jgi:hypothetical protein
VNITTKKASPDMERELEIERLREALLRVSALDYRSPISAHTAYLTARMALEGPL